MSNRSAAQVAPTPPRFLRAMDAPGYLGMCRDEFNKTVRPNVREFPIGKQGVGFDRIELDAWADAYVERKSIEKAANQDNNRPRSERLQGLDPWRERQSPASTKKAANQFVMFYTCVPTRMPFTYGQGTRPPAAAAEEEVRGTVCVAISGILQLTLTASTRVLRAASAAIFQQEKNLLLSL